MSLMTFATITTTQELIEQAEQQTSDTNTDTDTSNEPWTWL